jgi:hypothetical protein
MILSMPADESPIAALDRQFQMEDIAASPAAKIVLSVMSLFPFEWPFSSAIGALKGHLDADSSSRIKLMLQIVKDVILQQQTTLDKLRAALTDDELQKRGEIFIELALDAARRASNTRAKERVKRIGLILANGTVEARFPDADEIEEMMRIAMELNDIDILHLRELVKVEGAEIERDGRIARHQGFQMWEKCSWGTRLDGERDSVFSKLASYGFVAQIPPPNNMNIGADIPNRYLLLRKGLRFATLIGEGLLAED